MAQLNATAFWLGSAIIFKALKKMWQRSDRYEFDAVFCYTLNPDQWYPQGLRVRLFNPVFNNTWNKQRKAIK